jgi:hypothetical protein
MILKGLTKSLFYLDRDTDVNQLANEILRVKKAELVVFLERQHNRLQEKDAGEYFTVEDITKLKDGELEKMQRFFRGAVVPYYARQQYNIWSEFIDDEHIIKATEEIKKRVGFLKYDHTGHITQEVNSMATFERVKDLNEFLNMIQVVCFDDEGHIFPDSEYFKKLEKEKGRQATQRQCYLELHEKVKNKHFNREIIT